MGLEDMYKAGLDLGLGCERKVENRVKPDQIRQKACLKFDHLFLPPASMSLKLSLSGETYHSAGKIDMNKDYADSGDVCLQTSPHSAVSSFSIASVKRERDLEIEEMEVGKVFSRISDEDDEGNGRKKLRLTKEQSSLLEDSFKDHSTLNPKQKQALAKQLNLRPRQVEVWFQNRRARTKLKQTEVDCEFLKKCCETLTEENRRLHKELQELKALKMAPPLYMHVPAATLTMCPSCERIGGNGVSGDSSSKVPFTLASKPHFYNPFTHPYAAC